MPERKQFEKQFGKQFEYKIVGQGNEAFSKT